MPLARFTQYGDFLPYRCIGEEDLREKKDQSDLMRDDFNQQHTLVNSTLSGCTERIASVRPCKNDLVIAGSYTHSILPSTKPPQYQYIIRTESKKKNTHHKAQNTPPETPSAQTHPDLSHDS
jgi:hypothetical protein